MFVLTFNISRRKLIGTTAAGVALSTVAGGHSILAQDAKPSIGIGSKDFTESILLGEVLAQLLEANDYEVERQLNLGGTFVAHEATVSGEIDMYVEYTGTGWVAILDQELPEAESDSDSVPNMVYDLVSEAYLEEFGLEWMEQLGFNNTNAIAMRRADVEELDISTISDLQEHAGNLTIGASQEALARYDGVRGLEEVYDIQFNNEVGLDPGLMYSAIDSGEVDVIVAFSTDGRIESLDLVLLEDDRQLYPPYYAAPVVRQELLEESPAVRDILNSIAGTLDDSRMASLNFEVDEHGRDVEDVARDFLIEEGVVDGD